MINSIGITCLLKYEIFFDNLIWLFGGEHSMRLIRQQRYFHMNYIGKGKWKAHAISQLIA